MSSSSSTRRDSHISKLMYGKIPIIQLSIITSDNWTFLPKTFWSTSTIYRNVTWNSSAMENYRILSFGWWRIHSICSPIFKYMDTMKDSFSLVCWIRDLHDTEQDVIDFPTSLHTYSHWEWFTAMKKEVEPSTLLLIMIQLCCDCYDMFRQGHRRLRSWIDRVNRHIWTTSIHFV